MTKFSRNTAIFFCLILLTFSEAFAENWKFVFQNPNRDEIDFLAIQGLFRVLEESNNPTITVELLDVSRFRFPTLVILTKDEGVFNGNPVVNYFIDGVQQEDLKFLTIGKRATAIIPGNI